MLLGRSETLKESSVVLRVIVYVIKEVESMALFKVFRGSRDLLDEVKKTDGHAYFCTDDGSFWIDYRDENNSIQRRQINRDSWTADIRTIVKEAVSSSGKHVHSFIPKGTVSIPTFSGLPHTHKAHFDAEEYAVSTEYIPEGSISKPEIVITSDTTEVNTINDVGALPQASFERGMLPNAEFSKGELPTSTFDQGALPEVRFNQGTAPSASFAQGTLPTLSAEYNGESQTLKLNFNKGSLPSYTFTPGDLPSLEFNAGKLPTHSFNAGTLPELKFDAGELPALEFDAGKLPSKGETVMVMTGAAAALKEAPTFVGQEKAIEYTFKPSGTITIEDTIVEGTISQPKFSGTIGITSIPTDID